MSWQQLGLPAPASWLLMVSGSVLLFSAPTTDGRSPLVVLIWKLPSTLFCTFCSRRRPARGAFVTPVPLLQSCQPGEDRAAADLQAQQAAR